VARLPIATRESVAEDQRDIFDEIVKELGAVPRHGPGSVMIHVPKAHRWASGLNRYLRDESTLPRKVQELAMLVTARELDCQHIWNAHAASARKAGVPGALVDALRERRELPALAADEAAVVQYGREVFRTRRVSRGAFQLALEQFGRQGVVELGLVLGNYSLLALLINSFDTDLPVDRTEPLLPCEP
jgi:4-carboxymuconolactone decarboxylase